MLQYISIDLETTGLNPETCQILEFGAVFDDLNRTDIDVDDLPKLHFYVLPYNGDTYRGEPYALAMNHEIIMRIAKRESGYSYIRPNDVAEVFDIWLDKLISMNGLKSKKFTPAGKNYASFDKNFLTNIPLWEASIKTQHRSIDVGNLYLDLIKDTAVPSGDECLKRAGINKSIEHTAIADAKDMIRLIRAKVKVN